MNIVCPISGSIFHTPVLASDGFFYEEQLITDWLLTNEVSPITREPISKELYQSTMFKKYIESYLEHNPDAKKDQYQLITSNKFIDNIYKINNFVALRNFDKLLDYVEYDLTKMTNNNEFSQIVTYCKNTDILKHILNNTIDLNCVLLDNWRPVHYISRYCSDSTTPGMITFMINKLAELGLPLDVQNNDGCQPIHYICYYLHSNSIDTVMNTINKMIDAGLRLDIQNNDGYCAVLSITRSPTHSEIFKLIVDKGIFDHNIKSRTGFSILHELCQSDNFDNVKYAVENLKDLDLEATENYGWKPIHIAAHYASRPVIEYLLNKNVDLNAKIEKYDGKPSEYDVIKLLDDNKKIDNKSKKILIQAINNKRKQL